jgi:hypothetical protein
MMRQLLSSLAIVAALASSLAAQQAQSYYYPLAGQPMPQAAVCAPTPYPPVVYQQPPTPMLPSALASADACRSLKLDGFSEIGTMIPLTLPGYELRVMDVTKKITFDVNGSPVTAEVPLFIYMPRSTQSIADSSRELRKIYNDLILIYDQDRVDKERVRSMLKRMDAIIDSFDSITPSVARHSSAAY